ncbi:MAG TPA: hypothetical protein VHB97_19480, partial [Polyangia bacterium]|nr:hypothetical protein [Polyangia bacterium]
AQNATCNFWRGAENLAVSPTSAIDGGTDIWAVSQGTHLRRMHIKGNINLDDGGWSSGGFVADSLIDGTINSGSQQQFLTRNNDQNWAGGSWNMVFVGDGSAPGSSWPNNSYSVVAKTPVVREKPFLYNDAAGHYLVMVPSLKSNSSGHSWASGAAPGLPLAIDRFYIAKPTDTAASINAQLSAGKHILFTPGIYHLEASLQVNNAGTILLGLGLATLIPTTATPAITVADVDNVTVAGLLLEAGPQNSPTLLQLGPTGSTKDHSAAPTAIMDLHCRIGGADVGKAASCVILNSNNVLIDNIWLWRADHGQGNGTAGWTDNPSNNGIIVNGNNVTAYGLFVEHFQQWQTLWNGNGGSVYFYQSEMPYDPPNQAAWTDSNGHWGWASYKVGPNVTSHKGLGIGVYSVFTNDVVAENGIETPASATMNHLVIISLANGEIQHVINDTFGPVGNGTQKATSSY